MTSRPTSTDIADTILELCQTRGPEKTVCPSEAARALAKGRVDLDWRNLMTEVRQVAGQLVEDGWIEVCQKGQAVGIGQARGPIRLRWCRSQEKGRRMRW